MTGSDIIMSEPDMYLCYLGSYSHSNATFDCIKPRTKILIYLILDHWKRLPGVRFVYCGMTNMFALDRVWG